MHTPHILPPPPPPPPPSSSPPRRRLAYQPPSSRRPIRWGIAAAAAAILFALLLVSGQLLFDVLGQTHPCDTTTVVSDQTNTELIADCKVLWAARDTLRGTATLNWNATTAIGSWQGIRTSGTPLRVTEISFLTRGLNGSLPPELGQLSSLLQLHLGGNSLTGPIPPELGNLSNLRDLDLRASSLTGPIPPELGNLSNLRQLLLRNNRLSGEFPLWIENLGSLQQFSIQGNLLTGHLPLEYPLPSSISSAPGILGVPLGSATIGGGNMFIGCLPSWATATSAVQGEENLGLPDCGSPPGESVWVLDTALAPPSPLDGAATTKLTLRATYTIPAAYVTSTTTDGRLQFRSMSATAATGGAMTVSIARPATSTLPRLVGFDTRTGGTGIPAALELGRTTTINSNAFMCNTVSSTQTTVTTGGDARNSSYPS